MSDCHEIVVIIRPSFKKICNGDTCRTALFNHLLYWISRKVKNEKRINIPVEDIHWYGTAEEICTGMDDSWSVNKVRKEIKVLVDAGLIGQCHNPANNWDQTLHYFLGKEQGEVIRAACKKHNICLHCLGLTPDLLHLLFLVNAIDNEGKCKHQKSEIDLPSVVLPITKSGNAIPKDSTKVTSKISNKEEESASLSSPALSVWNIWCEAQGYKLERDWTKTERERCIALADMCEKGKITLTPQLMNEVREWAQAKQSFLRNDWALKNLINALSDYFKQDKATTSGQTEQEDLDKLVLHTRYRIYEDFAASVGVWFLFEEMTITEANKHGRAKSGGMGNRTEGLIRNKLEDESAETKQGLIEQWVSQRMAVAV